MEGIIIESNKKKDLDAEALKVFNRYVLNQDKLRILMVLGNKARANDFWVGEAQEDGESVENQKIKQVQKIVEALGLLTQIKIEKVDGRVYQRIYYANSQDALADLVNTQSSSGSRERDRRLGEIYGFPESAIAAFPEGSIDGSELPVEIQNHKYFDNLLAFKLSRQNYYEEWHEFVRMIDKLKNKFPILMRQMDMEYILD